eukprot:8211688-Pyramimonas_sp.AAC.1
MDRDDLDAVEAELLRRNAEIEALGQAATQAAEDALRQQVCFHFPSATSEQRRSVGNHVFVVCISNSAAQLFGPMHV